MDQLPILDILCLRHGKTNYTDLPRDLTAEGEKHVRKVGKDTVLSWFEEHRDHRGAFEVLSSPAPRARFTTQCILETIKPSGSFFLSETFTIEPKIGPTMWRDRDRARAACSGLSGRGYINYETEPVFADATIFEPPLEVRERWYTFLASYIWRCHRTAPFGSRQYALFVSHYEVLCNLVLDLFGIKATRETELQHAEPIYLSISAPKAGGWVRITGKFREQEAHGDFNLWERALVRRS